MSFAADADKVWLDNILADVVSPPLNVGGVSSAPTDLFAVQNRKAWKAANAVESRCDFAPNRSKFSRHGGVLAMCVWQKSVCGQTLSAIKSNPDNAELFAQALAALIAEVLGNALSPEVFTVVAPPARRHPENNFGHAIARAVARRLGLVAVCDCAAWHSRQRVNAVINALYTPTQPHFIVVDDIITTGSTFAALKNLFAPMAKNLSFFAGINNN